MAERVIQGPFAATQVTASGVVKGSPGMIHTVTVSPKTATPTAGLYKVFDGTDNTGTLLFSEWVFATDVAHSIVLDVGVNVGIYVEYDGTLANATVTVSYS